MKKNGLKRSLFVLLVVCGFTSVISAQTATKYGWRGVDRNGVYNETGLMKSWPSNGPTLLWESLNIGNGYSSPVIVGDRLYVTGMNDNETKEIFSCYTLDGKKVYSVEYGDVWTGPYPETRTTPAIDNGKAYVISGSGQIVCLNVADGKMVWSVDGGKVYQRRTGMWGTAECPLVYDNKVIYTPSGSQASMVALDKNTGELIWKSKAFGDVGGYVAPVLIDFKGKKQVVGMSAVRIFGVDPNNGEVQWYFDGFGKKSQGDNIVTNSPLYSNGKIFFSDGYDINGYQIQLSDDMKSVKLVWTNTDLDTHHGGYVLVNGTIYGSNWLSNNDGAWVAVDWNSGKTTYNEKWSGGKGKGSIIYSDGMLYCYDERRGTVGLVKPNPSKFEVVSEFRITKGEGPYWAHPVINNGVLYIRHGKVLQAYDIKQK
ncbi:MAG: PQQ-binding-like beta-propeller repeat protein [Bacteroidales bacterium]|nr:PQQ-binding-like beta-propeller repeat protein [Bacteroidales bacterium]